MPVMCFLKEKRLNLTRKLYAFKVVSVNIVTCYGSIDLRTSSDLSKRDFIKNILEIIISLRITVLKCRRGC